MIVTIKKLIKY